MLHGFLRRSAAATMLLLALAVHAKASAPVARPDPLDPMAIVPAASHRPSLSAYRPAHEVPLGSWKDANDTVTRIGGWRVYLREATQPEPAVPARPASTPEPAAGRTARP